MAGDRPACAGLNTAALFVDAVLATIQAADGVDLSSQRTTLINQIKDCYSGTFTTLFPFISYGVTKAVDYGRLETEGRALIQGVVDQGKEVTEDLL